jgi:hypothetical protein
MTKQVRLPAPYVSSMVAAVAMTVACGNAQAFRFDTGDSDVKMRWDNTFKYSTIYRLDDPDEKQLAEFIGTGGGDGDYNFDKGIASNRLDWLTEFDITRGDIGARVSAAAWYDSVYSSGNDNDTVYTHNLSVDADEFTDGTKDAVGRDVRLMDAFAFIKGDIGDMPARLTLGQHTVIYGETLMSGANGIANAQGPVDIVQAATVPGAQVKEFLLPTNQISANLRPTDKLSLGAYFQFEWEESPFFAPGSFLSPNDVMGEAAEALVSTPFGAAVARGEDFTPDDSGQWGMQLRYRPDSVDVELGFYAANYHDKLASALYFDPVAGTFSRVFHEDIRTYGVSASTVLGDDNVSIEMSVRDNQPLTGGFCGATLGCGYLRMVGPAAGILDADNQDNPAYAVGKTAHVTLVDIHLFQPNAVLKDGGSVAIQYDWHTVRSVDENKSAIDPSTSKSAQQITVAFTADYYQVAEGLDLSLPIVLSYNKGRSRVYAGWVEDGGSIDIGVKATYRNVWKMGANWHHFYGSHGTQIGDGHFDQTLWDRDYLSFNVSRAF